MSSNIGITLSFLHLFYGVVLTVSILAVLSLLFRTSFLLDLLSTSVDAISLFECGFTSSPHVGYDLLDIRPILSILFLFDIELFFCVFLTMLFPLWSSAVFVVTFLYLSYTIVEVVLLYS